MDASKVEYTERNDPTLWWKALPFLGVTASGASRSGENIISNYPGYIFKVISFNHLFLFVSTSSMFDQWRDERSGSVTIETDTWPRWCWETTLGLSLPVTQASCPDYTSLLRLFSSFTLAASMEKSRGRNCAQALCKHRDSFYSLNSRQVTHQTTQSQKQKGHRWVEISYKDGIVGVKAARWVLTIMDQDAEQKSGFPPTPGILLYLWIQIFLGWLCGKCCRWIYSQQVDV